MFQRSCDHLQLHAPQSVATRPAATSAGFICNDLSFRNKFASKVNGYAKPVSAKASAQSSAARVAIDISRCHRAVSIGLVVSPALFPHAAAAAESVETAASQFEPQMNSGVLIVCLIAAAPPIIFWGRIFFGAWRRQREADAAVEQQDKKQKDRDELKSKLFDNKRWSHWSGVRQLNSPICKLGCVPTEGALADQHARLDRNYTRHIYMQCSIQQETVSFYFSVSLHMRTEYFPPSNLRMCSSCIRTTNILGIIICSIDAVSHVASHFCSHRARILYRHGEYECTYCQHLTLAYFNWIVTRPSLSWILLCMYSGSNWICSSLHK